MKLNTTVTIQHILSVVEATVVMHPTDVPSLEVSGINEIHKTSAGDITFVDHPKYYQRVLKSEATFILINAQVPCPPGKVLLYTPTPFEAYQTLAKHFTNPLPPLQTQIAPTAVIGKNTRIDPGVVIYDHVTIGDHCHIRANVVLYEHTHIGNHVVVHAGTVIGCDAFYYHKSDGQYNKWHSIGRTLILDHVEIGACCTIDKGVSGDTIIGTGTKIDNHVHIGHGVVIGSHCLIAAQVGIAGKTTLGNQVTLLGQVGVSKSMEIPDRVTVYAQSGVHGTLQPDKTYFGSPAVEARAWFAWYKKLHELIRNTSE